jgi:hypothetical protein
MSAVMVYDRFITLGPRLMGIPDISPVDKTFDVDVDTRSSANENDYHVPFRFNEKSTN